MAYTDEEIRERLRRQQEQQQRQLEEQNQQNQNASSGMNDYELRSHLAKLQSKGQADRKRMAEYNTQPLFYGGNLGDTQHQPAMTVAEMEERQLAKMDPVQAYMKQRGLAGNALTPDQQVDMSRQQVGKLSDTAQNDLTRIIAMQQDYDTMAKIAPAYGAMLDAGSLQRRENTKKALDEAEAKFKKDNNLSDEEYNNLKDMRQRITNAEYNENQKEEIRRNINTGNRARDYANIGLYTVGSTLNYPIRGAEALLDIAAQKKNPNNDLGVDIYGKGFANTNLTNNIRQEAGERIANGRLGETGRNLYQTGASIADSIYGGALAGAVVPQVNVGNKVANWFANKGVQALGMAPTIGASAAATAYQDARNRGLDEKSAEATALASGLIEIGTESVSLDNLFDIAKGNSRLLRKPLIQMLASAGIEGSEEWASEGLNAFADWLINDGQSEYEQAVEQYKANGMTDKEARNRAKLDVLHDANEAFKWGAVSGILPGAGATAIGTAVATRQARNLDRNMDYEALGRAISTDESQYTNKSALRSAETAKQQAEDFARRKEKGEKISNRELRDLYWNMQDAATTETESRGENNESPNPSIRVYDAIPDIITNKMENDKINSYNAPDTELTAEDVTRKMAQAVTADQLVSLRKQAETSENEEVRQAAQNAFEINQGRIMSNYEDQGPAEFEAAEAMPTRREAFNAGLENGQLSENASVEAQIAYREGRAISLARSSRQNVSENIKGLTVSADENSKLTGQIRITGKELQAVTDNGTVAIDQIADPAVKALYQNAAEQGTKEAAQVYLDNYATNMPIGRYTNAFDRYSVAGATNTMQFEEMYNKDTLLHKWMSKDQLQKIYDFGAREAAQQKLDNAARQNRAIAVMGTGKVIDNTRAGIGDSLMHMVQAMAKATGKDYVITDKAAKNINGYFNRSMQMVVLNAKNSDDLLNTLFHEGFGEVLKAHNAEGYDRVQQSIMDYLAENPTGFTRAIKNYQGAYTDVEGEKSLYDAASEMINDSIAGLFSTEEGIHDFSEWADKKFNPEEKKTLFQNIADYFARLVDSFKEMLGRSRLSDSARQAARMGEKRAAEIRQMILKEMDIATENAAGLQLDESLRSEDDNAYSLQKNSDEDVTRAMERGDDLRYSVKVTDPETIRTLENQDHITTYRSFQVIDGGLYAPMAAMDYEVDENGKKKGKRLGYRSEIGQWEQATEAIDVARTNFANGKKAKDKNTGIEYAKFDLEGGDNQTGGVAYNPYLHSSNVVLNDQFAAAYRRNLVVVECEVPASELTSGYRAELAKDPTGWREWKSGAVAGEIAKQKKGFERQVFLSRWMKPVRILDDSEVASMYKEYLEGTDGIKVPWNVVTPSLRHELEKQGVPIDYSDRKFGSTVRSFAEAFPNEDVRYSVKVDSQGRDLSEGQQEYFKNSKIRDENGALKPMYHGTARMDRVGTIFDPARATSGPMAFFTDDRSIAENYARDKDDTSKAYDERYDNYHTQFRTMIKGQEMSVEDAWNKLPASKKNEIKNKAEHITMDDDWENIIFDADNKGGLGNFDSYLVKENGGNYIKALVSSWLDDGNLFGEESKFLEVLRYAGLTDVQYMDPEFRDEGVYEVYLNVTNPLDTSNIPENIVDALRDASKTAKQGDSKGADMWDKNSISPALWIQRLNDSIENDNTNVWTSIPDWVTDVLKENGYDGIIDQGGKYHQMSHQVVIPFSSEQIKRVDNQNPTENIDIRYSLSNDFVDFTEMDMFQPDENGVFAEEEMASILEEGAAVLKDVPIDKKVIGSIARKMTKFYGSSYSSQSLADNLEKIFAYAKESDLSNARDLARVVKEVAMPVIEAAENKTGGQDLQAAKQALSGFNLDLTDRQRQEVMHAFGSYVNYKREMKKLGVTISANGTSMDSMWTSLTDALPGTLPEDTVEGDMPIVLYDQLVGLGSRVENGFGMDNDEAAQDLALKIMSEYYTEMGKQEGIKKTDQAKLQAQAQRSKKVMDEYRNRIKNQYDKRYQKQLEKLQERYDEKTAKKMASLEAASKRKAERSRDAALAREEKDKIRKNAGKLMDMLQHPTKTKHVPAVLQDTVIDLVSAIDFVAPKITKLPDGRFQTKILVPGVNGHRNYETYTGNSYMEVMNKYQEALANGQGTKAQKTWQAKLSAVRQIYKDSEAAVASGDAVWDYQNLLKSDLGDALERVITENNGRPSLQSLSSEDLKVVNKVVRNIYTAINNIDKSYSMPEQVSEIGNSVIKRGASMKSQKDRLNASKLISRFMKLDNATPETFFHGMGEAGDKIYKALFEAQNQKARFEREDRKFMDTIFERVPIQTIQSWTSDKSPIVYEDGDFKLRVDQIMTLYEINKRQSTQAHQYEGFKAGTIKINGKEHIDENPHILTKEKINEITSHLTEDQKWVADQLQQYMATVGSKRGNDQTLKIYGYEMFTEPDYFPAQVDKTTVQTNAQNSAAEGNINGILNAGFTKEIQPNAKNPLILNSIFDVYLDHMNQVNTYASHAGVLSDINRINNYKEKENIKVDDQTFGRQHTVKQALDSIFGSDGKEYLLQFLKDVNQQEMATKTGAGVLAILTKNFKSAATLGNLRVVAQQPTAWCRALAVMDPKYMAAGLVGNRDAAKLQEETSMISWIKDNGNIDGLTTQSQRAQVLGLQTRKEKINELTGWLAGKADSVTWAALYRAVYAEQKDKFKGKTDSDEFKKAVNDRFDEVIARTQVVDGTLMRSQMMRSTDRLNMNFSAFMAEPTKTYNMFLRQFNDMIYEKRITGKIPRKAWEMMSRIIAAHVITQFVNAIPQSVMDAARDEEEGSTFWERFLSYFGINVDDDASALEKAFTAVEGNFLSNLGVIDKIPVLSTINDNYVWPWIKQLVWGESTYTSSADNEFQALNAIDLALKGTAFKSDKSKLTKYGSAARIANAISMVTGIPAYGLIRDTVAIYNSLNDLWGGDNIRRNEATSAERAKPVLDVIKAGGDYKAAIEKAVARGAEYSKIETQIADTYKQQYIDLMREGKTSEASKLENRLLAMFEYLDKKEGQKSSNKKRVKNWYTDWQEKQKNQKN